MGTSSVGGVPRGDRERDDLNRKIPEPMISFKDVRKGWKALRDANTRFLNYDGTDITDSITDTMIDSSGKDFEAFFSKFKLEARHMSRLIADAAEVGVDKLPPDSILYLEELGLMSIAIPQIKKTTYTAMPDKDRLKLARFLYRPKNERPLPIYEKINMLYPHGFNVPADQVVEEPVEIDDLGLRRLTWNLIESEALEQPSDEQIQKLWNERTWTGYLIGGEVFIEDARIARHNLPEAIERIISDVIGYLSTGLPGNKKVRDINKITEATRKVLPHRDRLAEKGYFDLNTYEVDRYNMLQKIFEGRLLL